MKTKMITVVEKETEGKTISWTNSIDKLNFKVRVIWSNESVSSIIDSIKESSASFN